MKFLHTADWHIGRTMKRRSRADEFRALLGEIEDIARKHEVDLIIVSGDLFDRPAPMPEDEQIVYGALERMADIAPVVAVAGNHDSPARLKATKSLLHRANVHVSTTTEAPTDGGVLTLNAGGETVKIAQLPWLSTRGIVKIGDWAFDRNAHENVQKFAERARRIVDALTSDFDEKTVNIFCGHLYVVGGQAGGGERGAHIQDDYHVPAEALPASLSYAALGHLHRPQKVGGKCPIYYAGSPAALDFGEGEDIKSVYVVEAKPGIPAKVEQIPLKTGRELRTIRGSFKDIQKIAASLPDREDGGETWLRVFVNEPRRTGLAQDIRELLGDRVISVEIDQAEKASPTLKSRRGVAPHELFATYCKEMGVNDEALTKAFAQLLDEVSI